MIRYRLLATALLATATLVVGCSDDDDTTTPDQSATFNVTLTKAAEVPVCTSAGTTAAGTATVTINSAGTVITVTNLTYTGLSGAATLGHIHSGAAGVMGPIVVNFGTALTSPINGTFTSASYASPVPTGAPATFAAFITAMRSGQSYINIHTAACPTGEIRGQLNAVTAGS